MCVFMVPALKPALVHSVESLNSEPADVISSSSIGNRKYSFKSTSLALLRHSVCGSLVERFSDRVSNMTNGMLFYFHFT